MNTDTAPVRIPRLVHQQAKAVAALSNLSLSRFATIALEREIARAERLRPRHPHPETRP